MNIAICEDSKDERINIKSTIDEYFNNSTIDHSITEFDCGESLINVFKKDMFNLIFLDIYMKNLNGIDAARSIRAIDPLCCIIFITSSLDYSLEAFNVEALDYLVKPISKMQIEKSLARFERFYGNFEKYITIKENGITKNILINKINYIEVNSNYCYINTDCGIYKTRSTLSSFVSSFKEINNMIQCHNSFLVNLDKVIKFEKNFLTLGDNNKVPISRKYSAEFKKNLADYLTSKM